MTQAPWPGFLGQLLILCSAIPAPLLPYRTTIQTVALSGSASTNYWLGSKAWVQARSRPSPHTSHRACADTSSSSAIQLWSCYVRLFSTMSPLPGPCWNLTGFQAHPSFLGICPRWAWGLPVSASCMDRAEGVQKAEIQLRQDMQCPSSQPTAPPHPCL